MKPCIDAFRQRFDALSEKQQQWSWFVGLWFFGLVSVMTLGYTIKFFMFIQL